MFEIVKRKVPIPGAIRLAMLVFGLFGVGFGTSSHAQEVPSTVDPGQIERDLRGSREPIRVQPTNPEFGITQEVPDVPEGAENISFVLEQISFTGEKSVYRDDELLGDFKSRIGQEVTVTELFEAAAQMSARYRNSGYLLSSVIVPAQEIDSGAVIFQVIEGHVDQLIVDAERVSEKYPGVVSNTLTVRGNNSVVLVGTVVSGVRGSSTFKLVELLLPFGDGDYSVNGIPFGPDEIILPTVTGIEGSIQAALAAVSAAEALVDEAFVDMNGG